MIERLTPRMDALTYVIVEPGTEIVDDFGNTEVVDDATAVVKNRVLHITQKTAELLKECTEDGAENSSHHA